jgi:hypothetical protein
MHVCQPGGTLLVLQTRGAIVHAAWVAGLSACLRIDTASSCDGLGLLGYVRCRRRIRRIDAS